MNKSICLRTSSCRAIKISLEKLAILLLKVKHNSGKPLHLLLGAACNVDNATNI